MHRFDAQAGYRECPASLLACWPPVARSPCGMLLDMKNGMRSVKDAVTGQTAKNAIAGTGLFGGGGVGAAVAFGCLLIWLVLAVVIVLVWTLVALLAAALPL